MNKVKTLFQVLVLVLKNHIDQMGLKTYLFKISGLNFISIILLMTILSNQNDIFTIQTLAPQYVYFIPLLALSSTLSSWEIELFSLMNEEYILHSDIIIPTRLFLSFLESFFPCSLFIALIYYSNINIINIFIAVGLWFSYALLGTSIGFMYGFYKEKSINNFLNLVVWILGFGPGPFFWIHS